MGDAFSVPFILSCLKLSFFDVLVAVPVDVPKLPVSHETSGSFVFNSNMLYIYVENTICLR